MMSVKQTVGQDPNKITALYERLSRDDDQVGDSNSIVNQKKYLESYAEQRGYTNIRHYTDDGWSGGNFNRPGFQEMENKRARHENGGLASLSKKPSVRQAAAGIRAHIERKSRDIQQGKRSFQMCRRMAFTQSPECVQSALPLSNTFLQILDVL